MISLSVAQIADVVGGRLNDRAAKGALVTSVCADSRLVQPGAMFAAFSGERVDGHDFAESAVRDGAVVVLASREVAAPAIIVDDVLEALGRCARAVIDRLDNTTVVAVTGSAGKTTTKDLIATLLSHLGPTVAATGSQNNELGLPLTVMRADASTRYLVLEMGARDKGHITYLCEIAPPDISVELVVGDAHLGVFGSREAVSQAKAELVAELPPTGLAILNADDPAVAAMAAVTDADVVTFGRSADADVRAVDVVVGSDARAQFELAADEERATVQLSLVGEHQVTNALAAASVAWRLGLPLAEIASCLSATGAASPWRMAVSDGAEGVTVINDAYNASPEATQAAVRTLAHLAERRRSIAVLGEMRELGPDSVAHHRAVGELCAQSGIDRVIVVGEGARGVFDAIDDSNTTHQCTTAIFVPDVATATAVTLESVRPNDVVLVKASRAVGLETLAHAVLERGVA